MEVLFLWLLAQLTLYGDFVGDPINEGWQGRQALREFECERLSQAEAHQRHPVDVPAPNPRTQTLMRVDALVCERRVVKEGVRHARDDVILQTLREDVDELAGLAAATGTAKTRWVVDAYYPDLEVTRKIASSARVALAERGLSVSDAPPRLTAGDVEVFRTLSVRDALPMACRRMHALGTLEGERLGDDVGFLAIALVNAHESQLHAGTCRDGEFKWLR